MDDFHPTEENQREIDCWRSQSIHHMGFSDKEAWKEIQREKHAKTLAGRVEKKITEVKVVTKNVTTSAWQGTKNIAGVVWNKVSGFWQESRTTIIAGVAIPSFIVMLAWAVITIRPGISNKNITNPDQRELVATRNPALAINDLDNFQHLVKIERFFDDQCIIEFLTEDDNCVALKFEPATYIDLKTWENKDPRVMYALWKMEQEKALSENK